VPIEDTLPVEEDCSQEEEKAFHGPSWFCFDNDGSTRERDTLALRRRGLVAYLCRSDYSFRLPGVRRPGGFYLPKLNAFGAGYRSR
jgi:hypothetical protein